MFANLLVIGICCLMFFGVYFYFLRKKERKNDFYTALFLLFAINMFLMFNALTAYKSRKALLNISQSKPITNKNELEELPIGTQVVLETRLHLAENTDTPVILQQNSASLASPHTVCLLGNDSISLVNQDFTFRNSPANDYDWKSPCVLTGSVSQIKIHEKNVPAVRIETIYGIDYQVFTEKIMAATYPPAILFGVNLFLLVFFDLSTFILRKKQKNKI